MASENGALLAILWLPAVDQPFQWRWTAVAFAVATLFYVLLVRRPVRAAYERAVDKRMAHWESPVDYTGGFWWGCAAGFALMWGLVELLSDIGIHEIEGAFSRPFRIERWNRAKKSARQSPVGRRPP